MLYFVSTKYKLGRRILLKLHNSLSERKENGQKLNFDELSNEELKQLFIDEMISDNRIAELFNVKNSKVTF